METQSLVARSQRKGTTVASLCWNVLDIIESFLIPEGFNCGGWNSTCPDSYGLLKRDGLDNLVVFTLLVPWFKTLSRKKQMECVFNRLRSTHRWWGTDAEIGTLYLTDIINRAHPGLRGGRMLIKDQETLERKAIGNAMFRTDIGCGGTAKAGGRCKISTEALLQHRRYDCYARRPEDIRANIVRGREDAISCLLLRRHGLCRFHAAWRDVKAAEAKVDEKVAPGAWCPP